MFNRTCMTRRLVVALLQSLVSSRHSRMYSFCSIFWRTMPSTCLALFCITLLRRPGAAEIRPAACLGLFQACVSFLIIHRCIGSLLLLKQDLQTGNSIWESCLALFCITLLRRPGGAEIRPATLRRLFELYVLFLIGHQCVVAAWCCGTCGTYGT